MSEAAHPESIRYRDILREKEFLKYIAAKLISRFGDSIDTVAYGWMVFQLTGSAVLLASLYAVNGIPSLLLNMVSGVVVGYLPKKTVVFICDLGRGLVVLITALLFINGLLDPWHLFLFTFLNSSFEAFRVPSEAPLFTQIVSRDKYQHAVSLDSSVATIVEILGFACAGLLIALLGIGGVIVIDAITFIVCGLIILALKVPVEEIKKNKLTVKRYFADLAEGVKYVAGRRLILSVCLFAGVFNMFVIPFNAMQPAYVDLVLNRGPVAISVISVSLLGAMSIGSIIVPYVKKKLSGFQMFIISGMIIGLSYMGFSQLGRINDTFWVYVPLVLLSLAMGIAAPILSIPLKVAIMSNIEKEYLPRAVSLVNSLALCTAPLGGGLVGVLCGFLSIPTIYLIFSTAVILLFLLQLFNKSLRGL